MKNLPYNIIRKISNKANNNTKMSLRSTSRVLRKLIPRPYALTHFFDSDGNRVKKQEFARHIQLEDIGQRVNVKKIKKFIKDKKLQYGDIVIHPALKSKVNLNENPNVKTAWNEMDIKYKIGIVDENGKLAYTIFSLWEGFLIPKKFHNLGINFFKRSPLAKENNYGFENKYGAVNVVNGEKMKINQPTRFGTRFINKTIRKKALEVNGKEHKINHRGSKITLPYRILTLKL